MMHYQLSVLAIEPGGGTNRVAVRNLTLDFLKALIVFKANASLTPSSGAYYLLKEPGTPIESRLSTLLPDILRLSSVSQAEIPWRNRASCAAVCYAAIPGELESGPNLAYHHPCLVNNLSAYSSRPVELSPMNDPRRSSLKAACHPLISDQPHR